MELSISLTLPRNLYKRNKLINDLEKEIQRQGYLIISREINQHEYLLVYENHLTIEETEKIEKEYKHQNRYLYMVSGGVKLDVRASLVSLALSSLLLLLLLKLNMAILLEYFVVVFLILMIGIYYIVLKYLNK